MLCLAAIATMMAKPYFTNASRPLRGIIDPQVALQMARNVNEVDAVLGDAPSPDREVMRIKQYVDFGFIAFYGGLFVALGLLAGGSLGFAAALAGVAAAVFDVLENLAILRILDVPLAATTQGMIDAIRRPSYAKWTLAFVALALLSRFFLAGPGWLRRTVGVLGALAAAIGFYGLYDNAALVFASGFMALTIAGIAGLFFRLR